MIREYWDIAPPHGDAPGTVHLDRYESECSPQTIARIVGEEARAERERERLAQKAMADPNRHAADHHLWAVPHAFSGASFTVRPTSHAELERRDEEQRALRFLRGGKG